MAHDSQVANAPLRIVFPCNPAERWDNKAPCRRALSQPSRQRPVQPGNLFPHPFYTTCGEAAPPSSLNQPSTGGPNPLHPDRAAAPFIFSARRAPPQPSRQRPVQPENLFRNPFTQPACASRPQPAAKPRPFPLSPLYSAPEGRLLPL